MINELLQNGPSYKLMKKLSKYGVKLNKTDFGALQKAGVVNEKAECVFVVEYNQQYDEHLGLRIENDWTEQSLII